MNGIQLNSAMGEAIIFLSSDFWEDYESFFFWKI